MGSIPGRVAIGVAFVCAGIAAAMIGALPLFIVLTWFVGAGAFAIHRLAARWEPAQPRPTRPPVPHTRAVQVRSTI